MPEPAKRTPRACERCRQTRRRCEPPYPCRPCVAAGTPCNVRTKARPKRLPQHKQALVAQPEDSSNRPAAKSGLKTNAVPEGSEKAQAHAGRTQVDTFELVKTLVHDVLLERNGYEVDCSLVEPPSCKPGDAASSAACTPTENYPPPPLNPEQTWRLLKACEDFMGLHEARLVNAEDLFAIARTYINHLAVLTSSDLSMEINTTCFPVDSIALIMVALAQGAVAIGEFHQSQFYFDLSTNIIKHSTGEGTLDLCIAFFLQHRFALRAGTSSYAQGFIAQAIQTAHGLGLQRNSHGTKGLQLYLLIYMADQYCSLTYSTEPLIRTSRLQGQLFQPLSDAQPHLQTLINLVTTNGYIIEHSHQLQNPDANQILELETRIGAMCSRQAAPTPSLPGDFKNFYEPLAKVHMLCCRLNLRAPGLLKPDSWLSSICICLHAAEGVLATYFELYRPVLRTMTRQPHAMQCTSGFDQPSTPITCKLPSTWRGLRRIMMATFVVIFAYWHGEMVQSEAARYMAMARLMLECPRWRWGEKLDKALQTLLDICRLGELPLFEGMITLLPGASENILRALCDFQPPLNVIEKPIESQVGVGDEFRYPTPPVLGQNTSESILIDDMYGCDLNLLEQQAFFGLWDPFELPMESDCWIT